MYNPAVTNCLDVLVPGIWFQPVTRRRSTRTPLAVSTGIPPVSRWWRCLVISTETSRDEKWTHSGYVDNSVRSSWKQLNCADEIRGEADRNHPVPRGLAFPTLRKSRTGQKSRRHSATLKVRLPPRRYGQQDLILIQLIVVYHSHWFPRSGCEISPPLLEV